ncbi:magnesium-translocating P-type ATPase [Roseixanthobacter pseudopolyaromaticivorans]|uniref:magnesium-translocating P-type ATPase n=1 Tax=Xanthobacteraceae TaxID=335928 RepID=UPI00372A55E1
MAVSDKPFWTLPVAAMLSGLGCTSGGLSAAEVEDRRARYGVNADSQPKKVGAVRAVVRRLLEPLSLILLAAGAVSVATGDAVGGTIILAILGLSIILDTVQEGQALKAAEMLRRSVAVKAEAKRDGAFVEVDVGDLVPGDLVRIRAGDIIPADARVLEANAFTCDEAALTGEPYPVRKQPGVIASAMPAEADNAVFRGAVAQTGEALALVVHTGRDSLFGEAASALAEVQAPSPFQRDLHAFGLLTARLTLALVLLVLTAHMLFGRPVLESLMFAVALAVGLTPELLPMITTVTLSRGALRMAARKVIVKRLAAIHDLGAMNVLCTDKTGTLTEAHITLAKSLDPTGAEDPRAATLAKLAARLGGDRGALDAALLECRHDPAADWVMEEVHAFDFSRRIGSVLVRGPDAHLLIVKGAPEGVLKLCATRRDGSPMDAAAQAQAHALVQALAGEGLRAVAVASKPWTGAPRELTAADETGLVFEGLCAFADPPKATAAAAIARLAKAGVRLKILSGDDPVVVRRLAGLVGLKADEVLSGADVAALSDDALAVRVREVDAYGRLAPDQKSRIVKALQARGAVVGFLGDGINDAPGLKAADIGLSVDGATGVAQAAADMILLESDLGVVADGVEEGRRTFVNILKYVRMAASSNFGNMLSMAAASLFLPFLPMLPTQILLNNLLYDLSEIGIPFDRVRAEALARPQVWDMSGLVRFAAIMGPLSSVFDLLTFGGLIFLFHVTPDAFRTAWFLESMATQILVIFIIRTRARPWADLPHPLLAASSLGALLVAMVLPFTPFGAWFGFALLPPALLGALALLVVAYLAMAEGLKRFAMKRG